MNTDLKYRFDEIITAVRLAPEMEPDTHNEPQDWVFPNLTAGLSAPEMCGAIICQTFKEDDEFAAKLMTMLSASFVVSADKKDKPDDDDLHALAIACNIMWAKGATTPLFVTLGMLAKTVEVFDLELPELALTFLRSNAKVGQISKLNPYDFLDDTVAVEDMAKVLVETPEN